MRSNPERSSTTSMRHCRKGHWLLDFILIISSNQLSFTPITVQKTKDGMEVFCFTKTLVGSCAPMRLGE